MPNKFTTRCKNVKYCTGEALSSNGEHFTQPLVSSLFVFTKFSRQSNHKAANQVCNGRISFKQQNSEIFA